MKSKYPYNSNSKKDDQQSIFIKCFNCNEKPASIKCYQCKNFIDSSATKLCYQCDQSIHSSMHTKHQKEVLPYQDMFVDKNSPLKKNAMKQSSPMQTKYDYQTRLIAASSTSYNNYLSPTSQNKFLGGMPSYPFQQPPSAKQRFDQLKGTLSPTQYISNSSLPYKGGVMIPSSTSSSANDRIEELQKEINERKIQLREFKYKQQTDTIPTITAATVKAQGTMQQIQQQMQVNASSKQKSATQNSAASRNFFKPSRQQQNEEGDEQKQFQFQQKANDRIQEQIKQITQTVKSQQYTQMNQLKNDQQQNFQLKLQQKEIEERLMRSFQVEMDDLVKEHNQQVAQLKKELEGARAEQRQDRQALGVANADKQKAISEKRELQLITEQLNENKQISERKTEWLTKQIDEIEEESNKKLRHLQEEHQKNSAQYAEKLIALEQLLQQSYDAMQQIKSEQDLNKIDEQQIEDKNLYIQEQEQEIASLQQQVQEFAAQLKDITQENVLLQKNISTLQSKLDHHNAYNSHQQNQQNQLNQQHVLSKGAVSVSVQKEGDETTSLKYQELEQTIVHCNLNLQRKTLEAKEEEIKQLQQLVEDFKEMCGSYNEEKEGILRESEKVLQENDQLKQILQQVMESEGGDMNDVNMNAMNVPMQEEGDKDQEQEVGNDDANANVNVNVEQLDEQEQAQLQYEQEAQQNQQQQMNGQAENDEGEGEGEDYFAQLTEIERYILEQLPEEVLNQFQSPEQLQEYLQQQAVALQQDMQNMDDDNDDADQDGEVMQQGGQGNDVNQQQQNQNLNEDLIKRAPAAQK